MTRQPLKGQFSYGQSNNRWGLVEIKLFDARRDQIPIEDHNMSCLTLNQIFHYFDFDFICIGYITRTKVAITITEIKFHI